MWAALFPKAGVTLSLHWTEPCHGADWYSGGRLSQTDSCLTRKLSGDGAMPHDASDAHDLVKGHAAAVFD